MHIVTELENRGYQFEVVGGNIKYKYTGAGKPDSFIDKPLLAEMKKRKEEAVNYILSRQQTGVVKFDSEAAKIKKALKERGIVKIYSHTLGEAVYWARDDREAARVLKGEVCYTEAELKHLVDLKTNPEKLKQVHKAKKVFGGKLMDGKNTPFSG